ncbi:MAG: hypothetical protein V7749_09400 [Cocleimonas sp.]
MTDKIKSSTVYCKDKQRDVTIEFTDSGTWYSPCRKLISCPAIHDGGGTCSYGCLREMDAPLSLQRNK